MNSLFEIFMMLCALAVCSLLIAVWLDCERNRSKTDSIAAHRIVNGIFFVPLWLFCVFSLSTKFAGVL